MEEDLKILEEIKDMFIHLKNYGWINDIKKDIDTDKAIQAIEHLIIAYKELKEIEQIHRQENGELREKVKELEEDYTSVYLKGVYDERDKWIALVKEKIEKLDKKINDIPDNEGNFSKAILIRTKITLQELLEKRK